VNVHRIHIVAIWCMVLIATLAALGLQVEPPYREGFHPLDVEPQTASPLNFSKPAILKLTTSMFSDTAQIDFEKRQVTFRRVDPLGYTMWEFHYGELSDYLASRRNFSVDNAWKKRLSTLNASDEMSKQKSMKLEWELPVQYPSWAQRVLGKEPPKLKIDGFLEIIMGYQNNQYDQGNGVERYRDNNEFKFDINYQFGITGSIGRLINIAIRADKEQNFDISDNLKNFKVEYKEQTPGELEDEIIQEVIVGYTGFSLPGTNLSGYSESKEGLFGIKIRSKLGPLDLTSIVSTEQGQSNKKSYNSGAGSQSGSRPFPAKEYLKDRYFFLDTTYRKAYIQKYAPQVNTLPSPPKITQLSVWRNYSRGQTNNQSNIKNVRLDSTNTPYLFERLERDVHYRVNVEEGYIRLADSLSLQADQQIAIYMRTTSSSLQRGTFERSTVRDSVNNVKVGDTVYTLWVLRPNYAIDSLGQDPERYSLMWRHAYGPADFGDLTNFKLAVKRENVSSGVMEQTFSNSVYYADTMKLTKKNVPLTGDTRVFNKEFGDLIIPPFDTSDIGLEPFNNPAFGEFRDSVLYRYGEQHSRRTTQNYKNTWFIEMSGSSKRTTFDDLGWDIMEGTELVKADGVTLDRDRDYTISYSDGVIDLTSARAKAADKIEIEYQSGALFVPERKMFMGTHGKLDLPFISDKSYAGTSILFQSTSSNDNVPRLDQEPFSKMLFDINTHLEFEPDWMTTLVKSIPFVKTDATSSVTLDFELAHSRVNPNKSRIAYVDDFEDCKQSDPLGNNNESWFRASPPYSAEDLYWNPPAWDFYWFSPTYRDDKHRIRQNEILTLTEAEQRATQTGINDEAVVRLHVQPAPTDSLVDRYRHAWAGIMTPISQSFANKQLMQYFEFFVKADDGRILRNDKGEALLRTPDGKVIKNMFSGKGKLLIQMGEMREDISLDGGVPNGREDREDTSQIINRESYDKNLDLGWDGLKDENEVYKYPSASSGEWAQLGYNDPLLGPDSLDPAKDNFKEYYYTNGDVNNYRYASRQQGDGSIEYSEDINFDGVTQTSLIEKYFQFTVDLNDSNSAFIDSSAKLDTLGGWRKYRIPLKEILPGTESSYYPHNNPRWSNITMVRLIWTDFDSTAMTKEQSLVFNNMAFVGNQWVEVADSGRSMVKSSVVNTKEDKLYETMLEKYKDRINQESDQYGKQIEQSLRLNFNKIAYRDTAIVEKNLEYQTLNLSGYERLELMVFGLPPDNSKPLMTDTLWGGDIKFVFRFGSDDSTYYEYRTAVRPEWNNHISISLKALSDLKDESLTQFRDSSIEIEGGNLRVKASKGSQPNFTRIRWMGLGVIRNGQMSPIDSLSGEIWVNEMKLTGIRNIVGSASRAEIMTKWADLFSFQARMEYENGNFRRMTETQNLPDNTLASGSMGASVALERFLPRSLGVSIPAGVNYNTSISRPQLKSETDVFLVDDKGNPDDFAGTIVDAAYNMFGIKRKGNKITDSERFQTNTVGRTYYTGYRKSNRSENPFVSFLADRWSADARYSTTISEQRYGENWKKDTLYAKRDTSDTYSGKVQYDLTPYDAPAWTKWQPFKDVKPEWFPSQMKSYELTFLPSKFTVDVADVSLGKQRLNDTWRKVFSTQHSYTVRHNTALSFSPLSPVLDMDYSLSVNRDLVEVADKEDMVKARSIFKPNETWKNYMVLWGEKDRTQHTSISVDPRFFGWLTTSGSYTNDYTASMVKWLKVPEPYISASVRSAVALNGSFDLEAFLTDVKKVVEKSALGGLVDMAKKGVGEIGLRQFSLSYSASSDLKNNYISDTLLQKSSISILGMKDMFLYQTGVKGRSLWDVITGEMDDRKFLGMQSRVGRDPYDLYNNDSRTVDRSYRLSTSMTIKPLELSFRQLGLNYSINYNVRPDSSRNDTTITFPDATIGISTPVLNKLELVKKNLQSVDMTSTFSFRQSDRRTAQAGGSTRSLKYDFMPFIGLTGTLKKWPVRLDYRHNYSREISMALATGGEPPDTNRNVTMHTDEFSLNYEIEQGSLLNEIKLLTWTIPVKGRTTVGLKYNRTSEVETVAERKDESYSLVPNLSYIFTDNVTGRAEYKIAQTDRGSDKTTTNDFTLSVQIRF